MSLQQGQPNRRANYCSAKTKSNARRQPHQSGAQKLAGKLLLPQISRAPSAAPIGRTETGGQITAAPIQLCGASGANTPPQNRRAIVPGAPERTALPTLPPKWREPQPTTVSCSCASTLLLGCGFKSNAGVDSLKCDTPKWLRQHICSILLRWHITNL